MSEEKKKERKNKNCDEKQKTVFSQIVRIVFYLCLLGVIVFCTICLCKTICTFSDSQIDQAKAHSEVSAKILEQAKAEEADFADVKKPIDQAKEHSEALAQILEQAEAEKEPDSAKESGYIDQAKAHSEVLTQILEQVKAKEEADSANATEHMVEYLERLQEIQSENSTDSVMSFIFSILSSILVGLCAWFALKNFESLEIAKNKAKEAAENANDAKLKSDEAADKADKAEDEAAKAAKKAKDANKSAELAAEKAEESKNQYEQSKEEQQIFSKVLKILIDISDAKSALRYDKRTEATNRITEIERLTLDLSDVKQSYLIKQLLEELLRLESSVYEYEEYINNNSNLSQALKNSAFIAVERYKKQIKSAVSYCDKLIEQAELSEIV